MHRLRLDQKGMLLVDVPRRFDMHTGSYYALACLVINLTTHTILILN
jgi:hypothetical protein